jgi:hypothetical protein
MLAFSASALKKTQPNFLRLRGGLPCPMDQADTDLAESCPRESPLPAPAKAVSASNREN